MNDDQYEAEVTRVRRLTREQLEVLHKYGSMTDEDFDRHKRLLENEPDITEFFGKRKAFALVRESLQKGITWVVAIVGGILLGLDKIKAVFAFFIDIFQQVP
jgi:hypothetical protein